MTISGLIPQELHILLRKIFSLAWNSSDRLGVAATEPQKYPYNLFRGVSYDTLLLL